MSKSKLKPEDIFFSMQKTHEAKNRAFEEAKKKAETAEVEKVLEEAKKQVETAETQAPEVPAESTAPKPKAEKKETAPEKKKRGPVPKPENSKRVAVNVLMPPEVKYGAMSVINEMKMRGIKEKYSLTDFVIEAVEREIKRVQKQLDAE